MSEMEDEDIDKKIDNLKKLKEEKKKKNVNMIPRKLCANEVYKEQKKMKLISLVGIVGFFIIQLSNILHTLFGAIATLIFSGFMIYYLFMAMKKMKYLERHYMYQEIKPPFQNHGI